MNNIRATAVDTFTRLSAPHAPAAPAKAVTEMLSAVSVAMAPNVKLVPTPPLSGGAAALSWSMSRSPASSPCCGSAGGAGGAGAAPASPPPPPFQSNEKGTADRGGLAQPPNTDTPSAAAQRRQQRMRWWARAGAVAEHGPLAGACNFETRGQRIGACAAAAAKTNLGLAVISALRVALVAVL